jgi:hypothetical protein
MTPSIGAHFACVEFKAENKPRESMRRLKVAVIVIAVVAAAIVVYVAEGPLNSPVVACMRRGAGIGSGVLVNAAITVTPGKNSGNLTLILQDQSCEYISSAEVTSMRPSLIVNRIPHEENFSYPSLITNASFITYNGELVSPSNRVPIGGSAMGSVIVNGVQVGTSYTVNIFVSFSGNGISYANVTAEVIAA